MLTFGQGELDDLLEVKDKIIYHYTSFSVLPEFLKDDAELYCTTSEALNDPMEISLGVRLFAEYLQKKGIINERRCETMKRHINETIRRRWIDTWVMSLSSKGDNLSQWRGYVPGAQGGYAIGFNVERLYDALKKISDVANSNRALSVPCLIKCWYAESDATNIESLFAFQYATYKKEFDRYANSPSDALSDEVITPVVSTMIPTCMHIKHEGFKDECESRIVISPRSLDEYPSIVILGGKARLPLGFKAVGLKVRDCIEEVVVSPHGNRASLLSQVNWLQRKCMGTFKIKESAIPYDPSR